MGRQHSSYNRDRFLLSSLNHPVIAGTQATSIASLVARQRALLAVADGLGDRKGASIASEVAMESLGNYAQQVEPETEGNQQTESMEQWVREGLQVAKREIEFVASDHPTRHAMATSLTMALVCFPQLAVGQAGDCRCYLVRDGELLDLANHDSANAVVCGESHRTTRDTDHSASLNKRPGNCLGGGFGSEFRTTHVALRRHDWLVLATDGLVQHVDEDEICDLAVGSDAPRRFCHALRQLAMRRGAKDNVTAIACNWEMTSSPKHPPASAPC